MDSTATGDAGVPDGGLLIRFAEAAHRYCQDDDGTGSALPDEDLEQAKAAIEHTLGTEALHEATATMAIFNGLVRVADGTGIQLDAGVLADSSDFRPALGVDAYAGAANTETEPNVVDRSSVLDLFA